MGGQSTTPSENEYVTQHISSQAVYVVPNKSAKFDAYLEETTIVENDLYGDTDTMCHPTETTMVENLYGRNEIAGKSNDAGVVENELLVCRGVNSFYEEKESFFEPSETVMIENDLYG